jgi:hypothetical protein
MDAQRGIHGPDGLAGFGRIDAERLPFDDFGGGSVEHGRKRLKTE